MKCFVKITRRYADDAKRHACTFVIQRYKKEVEGHDDYEHNPRDVFGFGEYLKKPHKNFRTVLKFKTMNIDGEDIRCYVALCVFKRGSKEYESFKDANLQSAER